MVGLAESDGHRFRGEVNVLKPSEEFIAIEIITPMKASLQALYMARDHRERGPEVMLEYLIGGFGPTPVPLPVRAV